LRSFNPVIAPWGLDGGGAGGGELVVNSDGFDVGGDVADANGELLGGGGGGGGG
jgi:hypothetical protein